jgi:hypothetical protein
VKIENDSAVEESREDIRELMSIIELPPDHAGVSDISLELIERAAHFKKYQFRDYACAQIF